MFKKILTNMNISTFSLVVLTGFFFFAPLLPCGFSKEKTEQMRNQKEKDQIIDPKNWHSWTVSDTMWTATDAPAGIPLTLEQQQRLKLQKQQLKNGRSKERKAVKDDDLNVNDLKSKALKYGKMLFDFVTLFRDSLTTTSSSSFFSSRQSEGTARAGVVDWLARLIGVQGKSLGEFLREYQVHVLYDLVFTFFKWVFFLYAGLLIP